MGLQPTTGLGRRARAPLTLVTLVNLARQRFLSNQKTTLLAATFLS